MGASRVARATERNIIRNTSQRALTTGNVSVGAFTQSGFNRALATNDVKRNCFNFRLPHLATDRELIKQR